MSYARAGLIALIIVFTSAATPHAYAQNDRNDGHQGDYGLFGFNSSAYDKQSGETAENSSPSLLEEIFLPDNNRQKYQFARVFPSYPLTYRPR